MPSLDAPLAHDDLGQGIPVLFLHGFPQDRGFWDQSVSLLRTQARCVVPDLPGSGASPLPAEQPTLESVAAQLVALLDHAAIDQAVVCGLSMGGYLALALWRLAPKRVRALILCDTRATPDGPEQKVKRDAMIAVAEGRGVKAIADLQTSTVVGATTKARSPLTLDAVQRMHERQSVAGIVAALKLLRDRPDQTAVLATITVPTLVLVGAEDTITPPSEVEAMAERISGAICMRIPLAGHLSPMEQTDVFAARVGAFLKQIGD